MTFYLPTLSVSLQRRFATRLILLSVASALISCSPAPEDSTPNASPQEAPQAEFLSPIQRKAWHRGFSAAGNQLAKQLHHHSEQLHLSIEAFLRQPNEENRRLAQQNWLHTYAKFQAMGPALHYLKVLAPPNQIQHISLIDQWPIIPGYIDGVSGYPFSGIINDVTVTLDLKTVIAQHRLTDASEASVGLHVLEFLLWGESPDQLKPLQQYSPRNRWQPSQQERAASDHPNNRRRKYLLLLSELIRSIGYQTHSLWALPDNNRYSLLALQSLYQTLGDIRKDLHQPPAQEDNAPTFSGNAHRPFTARIQALLYFLPTAEQRSNGPQINSGANVTKVNRTRSTNHLFTQKIMALSNKINALLNDSEFNLDDKNWVDPLDFALLQLETTLFNAMGSPAVPAQRA